MHAVNLSWAFISRYAIDVILILAFVWWVRKKKKRRKRFLNRRIFFRVGILFLSVYVVIPQVLGPIVPRARYLPQYIEAQKLRLYYTAWATVIPGKSGSRSSIEREIRAASREFGFNPAFVKAVVTQESGFNQFAVSPSGGCGLMQLLPSTFYSLRGGNPFGVRANLLAGTKYLDKLYNRFDGRKDLTLAAYNAGPTNVRRYGGVPPFPETQRYVRNVLSLYERYKKN